MRIIDTFLNSITMYRLVLYGLLILAGISLLFGFTGLLPFSGLSMTVTLVLVLLTCLVTNAVFARIFKAVTNTESYLITALILFFILPPALNLTDALVAIAAGGIAMASKYLLALHKKHIFNPAAIGVFILGLFGFAAAIWWVGSLILLPFVIVLGLLIVRKIRRFHLVWAFLVPAVITICLFNLRNGLSVQESLLQMFSSWPLIFFATVMLTEPLTTPPRKKRYMVYGGLVGILFGLQFEAGPLFASPEFALVTGNIFSYLLSPKRKLFMNLKEKRLLVPSIYEFVFSGSVPFAYHPGQYLEWTVPPGRIDSRGNRRYFTIASSPTEPEVKLGVKIMPDHLSMFKKHLVTMKPGDTIVGAQLAGDFVLPEDTKQKLVFVAGGIGVTPFRSMIKDMLDKKEKRDIIFFYACSTPQEFVYQDIFDTAAKDLGVRVIYLITKAENAPQGWKGETGRLTDELIKKYVPDLNERRLYLSGPNAMVEGYKVLLIKLGVKRNSIVTDYFPGF
jgi:ferredoxin-NADP reductase/Na+-translocating ferredoxin:NAD+ oxidoreductase RnfD subunit